MDGPWDGVHLLRDVAGAPVARTGWLPALVGSGEIPPCWCKIHVEEQTATHIVELVTGVGYGVIYGV